MLLINIFINGFRSYASPTNIQLAETNTVLQGLNGSGKSSIIQALRYGLGYKYTSLSNIEIKNMLSESPGKDWRSAAVTIRLTLSIASLTKQQRTCLKNGKFPIAEENNEVVLERKIDLENDIITCNESKLNLSQLFYLLNILKITQIYEFSNIVSQNTIHTIVDMGAPNRTRLLKNYIGVSAFEKQIKGLSNFLEDLDKKDIPKLEESKTFIVGQLNRLESERDGLKELKDLEFKKDLLEYRIAEQKKEFLVRKLNTIEKLLQDSQKRIANVETRRERNEIEINEQRKKKTKLKNAKPIPIQTDNNTGSKDKLEPNRSQKKKTRELITRNEKAWKTKVDNIFKNHAAIINKNLIRFRKKLETQSISIDSEELATRATTLKSSVVANNKKLIMYNKKQKKLEKKLKTIINEEEKQKSKEKLQTKYKEEVNRFKIQRRKLWEIQNDKNEELNELLADRKEYRKRFRYAISLKNVLTLNFARSLDKHAGVYGALIDQINTNENYNKAVIASLGKRLFTILVENDESLKYCLNELRKFNGDNATKGLPFISVTFMKVALDASQNYSNKRNQGIDFKKFKPFSALLEVLDKKLKFFISNIIAGNILFTDKIEPSAFETKGFKIVDINGIVLNKGSVEGGYIEDYLGLNTKLKNIEKEILRTESEIENQTNELEILNKNIENKQTSINQLKETVIENNMQNLIKYKRKQRALEMNINKAKLSNDYLETQLNINKDLMNKQTGTNSDETLLNVLNRYITENSENTDIEGYASLESLAGQLEDKEEEIVNTPSNDVGINDVTNINSRKQIVNIVDNNKEINSVKGKLRKLVLKKSELERQGEVLMADINSKLRDKINISNNLEQIQIKINRVDDRYKDDKEGIKISLNEHNKIKTDAEINREISLIDTQLERVRKCTNKKADLYYERFLAKKIQIDKNVEEIASLQQELTQHLETFENIKTKFFTDLSNGIIKEFKQLMFYFDRSLTAAIEVNNDKLEFSKEVKDYSGGQKALVGLCFILAIKFAFGLDLLVLDEVDANLDVEYVKKFASLIKRENGKGKLKGQILLSSFKEDILNLEGNKKMIEISYEDGYSNVKETDY